jgi:hypothetical protein
MYSTRQAVTNVHPGEVDEIIPGPDILQAEAIVVLGEIGFYRKSPYV